jgi:hypothetical protein
MAISSVAKNFRDGTITLEDGTGSPITCVVSYENGDFSLANLKEGGKEINRYEDRGDFFSARKTTTAYPSFSFTAIFTDLSDGSEKTLVDACLKQGAFAAGVSTLGANADVWALKLTFVVEGTNFGDASDHICILNNCVFTDVSISEGDPDSFSISGEVLGSVTMT